MNSLYTDDVRRLYHSVGFPRGLVTQIMEEPENLTLVFFRNNFNSFDGEDRHHIAMLVKEFMEKVRGMGIPIYMQVKKGDGRDERT